LAEVINADTHPIQNLSVQYFHSEDPLERKRWAQHWIRNGLEAFEKLATPHAGLYSIGDQVTVADLCLIPQVYNAIRFEVDLEPLPLIKKIYDRAMATAECLASAPEKFEPAP
jgi:maleylacetoacetate isomerase